MIVYLVVIKLRVPCVMFMSYNVLLPLVRKAAFISMHELAISSEMDIVACYALMHFFLLIEIITFV